MREAHRIESGRGTGLNRYFALREEYKVGRPRITRGLYIKPGALDIGMNVDIARVS